MTVNSPPTLLQMPDDVMRHIMEKCDIVSIQSLRKTCHDLRNFIDDVRPDPKISAFYIFFDPSAISLTIHVENSQYIDLKYETFENGVKISKNEKENILENFEFSEIFSQDFKNLTENQKSSIEYAQISIHGLKNFPKNFEKNLKKQNFKIDKLCLKVLNETQILTILPCIDANFLKKLVIIDSRRTDVTLELEQIMELDQWKTLEEIEIMCFYVWKAERFLHFKKAIVNVMTVTVAEVELFRKTLIRTPVFNMLKFYYIDIEPDILTPLGPHCFIDTDIFGRTRRQWFYKTDDSEIVFSIVLEPNFICFRQILVFEVPNGAVIS